MRQAIFVYEKEIDDAIENIVNKMQSNTDKKENPLPETEERIKELYDLTAGLSDEQMALLKAYVAGMKSNL